MMKCPTLVIDLLTKKGKDGEHYGTLMVEQSNVTAYRVAALDVNVHGQLNDDELNDYVNQLLYKGFVEFTRNDVITNKPRPAKYFIRLTRTFDWNLYEISVMNNFHKHPTLVRYVDELDMASLGHDLLVTKWEITKKFTNDRGNWQINMGSNNLDMNDPNAIYGMNCARDHQKPKNLRPGLDGDDNIEDTLIRKQMVVTKIFDYIADYFRLARPFMNSGRRKFFSSRRMRERGCEPDDFRADGGTFFYSGLYPERVNGVHSATCRMHVDKNNDHRAQDGMNENICISQIVPLRFPNRRDPVVGRVGLNQYMKECNGNAYEKYKGTMKLLGEVRRYLSAQGVDALNARKIDWKDVQKRVKENADEGEDFATLTAHANKDCHYSWFMHVIVCEVVAVYGWNLYLLIEVIYTMSLTPSSVGWRKGVRYAMMARANEKNFFENFVIETVAKDDKVANHFGKRGRHQTSSQGLMSNMDWTTSCSNFLQLSFKASEDDSDTRTIYEDFASDPYKKRCNNRMPGLKGVKELTAFNLVNIATKMDVIKNKKHIRRVGIARNTETARRLRKYGITTDAHLREAVIIIAKELGIDDYQVVENLFCEVLRWLEGNESGKLLGVDIIAIGQSLYEVEGEELYKEDENRRDAVDFERMRSMKGESYNPRNKWWDPRFMPEKDYDLVLTKNSKKLKKYYEQVGEE